VVTTTRSFMRRWVEGSSNWDSGKSSGEVQVQGDAAAWGRMLLATGYPGRPEHLAEKIREIRAGDSSTN
jgi:hypothetical protein